MLTATGLSGREQVIEYLWDRVTSSFRAGDDEQAFGLFRFVTRLEDMTDIEYEETYAGSDEADV